MDYYQNMSLIDLPTYRASVDPAGEGEIAASGTNCYRPNQSNLDYSSRTKPKRTEPEKCPQNQTNPVKHRDKSHGS